ncbi:uncharacterized protein LOC130823658 [Amaranthus tricolor]|uniref:uncharacterized protein LOC130823658 n=1 Tax=Amaranthus tricolor TaxID=29722 RepID=UPI002583ECCB|nr:uncharacterized protein LOC130823658 [Amaranthus tricolor]
MEALMCLQNWMMEDIKGSSEDAYACSTVIDDSDVDEEQQIDAIQLVTSSKIYTLFIHPQLIKLAALCQNGLVQGIPPPYETEPELHLISRKNEGTTNSTKINGCHIARWDHRLELLAQGALIDAVSAPTTRDYMPWFLSITRRWMTPRGIVAAAHYALAVSTMTQFAQAAAVVIRSSHEEPVREIAQGMLLGTQFQYFTSKIATKSSLTTVDVHVHLLLMTFIWRRRTCHTPVMLWGSRRLGHPNHQSTSHLPYQRDAQMPLTTVGGVGDQLSWIG